jgi:mannosyltransferase
LPWLVAPTVGLVALALTDPSLYNPRYLTFCTPALALLVAAGGVALPRRATVAAAVVAGLLVVPVWTSQRGTLAKSGADLVLVAEQLQARARPGDAVYWGPRDDAVGGSVHRSLRTVALGYPDSVGDLVDVTLDEDPARGRTLFGTSRELAASTARLQAVDTLWVVRRQDRVAEGARDDALLSREGFRAVWSWRGSQTEVVEMRR